MTSGSDRSRRAALPVCALMLVGAAPLPIEELSPYSVFWTAPAILVAAMLIAGAIAGVAAGVASQRYIETLLYQVKATDPAMLIIPALTIFTAAIFAALPPVIHALRIDPAAMLRAD
jgi:Mg/Co/Ni transporter MgtE